MTTIQSPTVKKFIIRIIAFAFFMEILDGTALNTALPQIAKSLHHNPIDLKAAVTTYLLSLGIFIPVSGWCADVIGEKKTLLIAIVLFTLGSIGCACSVNLTMLICFRLLQGVGGGFLMPVARLILVRAFGRFNTVEAMAKVGMVNICAMVLGPILGGALTTYLSWRYIFIINVPMGIFALYYINAYLPALSELKKTPFDFRGFILLSLGLGFTLFLLDVLIHPNFTTVSKVSMLVIAAASFILYFIHEKRVPFPILSRVIFQDRSFNLISIGSFLSRLTLFSQPFLVPLLLQASYGYEAVESGLFILPTAIGALIARKGSNRLIKHFGHQKVTVVNSILISFVFASFALQAFVFMPVVLVVQQFIFGLVFVTQMTSMNAYAYQFMHEPNVSKASSFYSAVIQLSASFGVAFAGLTMVSVIGHADLAHDVPVVAFKTVFLVQAVYGLVAAYVFSRIKAVKPAKL